MRAVLRLTAALAAAGCALYPATLATEIAPPLALGVTGLAGLTLALITDEWVLAGPGVGAIVLAYAVALAGSAGSFDWAAPGVAVGCLLALELVDAATLTVDTGEERRVASLRLRDVGTVTILGAGAAVSTATAGILILGGSTAFLLAAAAFAGAAVAVVVSLATRAIERG